MLITIGMDKKVWLDREIIREAVVDLSQQIERVYNELDEDVPNINTAKNLLTDILKTLKINRLNLKEQRDTLDQ